MTFMHSNVNMCKRSSDASAPAVEACNFSSFACSACTFEVYKFFMGAVIVMAALLLSLFALIGYSFSVLVLILLASVGIVFAGCVRIYGIISVINNRKNRKAAENTDFQN